MKWSFGLFNIFAAEKYVNYNLVDGTAGVAFCSSFFISEINFRQTLTFVKHKNTLARRCYYIWGFCHISKKKSRMFYNGSTPFYYLPLKHAVCQSAHNIGKLQLSVRSLALALLVATETNGLVKFYGRCFSRALIVSVEGLRARSFIFGVTSHW